MLVSLENVTFGYTGAPIAEHVSFAINEGERVGFLGGNGEGKTTVLRLLLGELVPDEGAALRKNGVRIGYLEQSGGFDSDDTVYGAMEAVFERDRSLIARLRETEAAMAEADEAQFRVLSARAESLTGQIAARDSYHYDVRIRTVLNGMGFEDMYGQAIPTMSGGEKTRLKLCRLLLEEPELLILDEPTNHLDLKTLFWLEDYLSAFRGALLVVSHDRYFLDKLTTRTLELEGGRLYSYKGNYSKYRVLKAERVLREQREYEKQQEEIAALKDYVDRNIVRATTARSALSRVNKLERMDVLEKPYVPPAPPRFSFPFEEKPYENVLTAVGFDLYAEDKLLLKKAEFSLMRGQKCALTGDNGAGKSTLLKFLRTESAHVAHGKYVKIAYYDQENADLDPEDRALDAFRGRYPLMSQTEARALLARSGLDAGDVDKKVKELSGGLRAKLELCILQASGANVLFLDEPTNHLDLPAREALEDALKRYEGTLLFVSHDRRFIEAVATRIAHIADGELFCFEGSYDEFLRRKPPLPEKKEKTEKTDKKEISGYRSKEERAREAQRKERIKRIERELETLEAEEAELNEELVRRAADYLKVRRITDRLGELRTRSDELYSEYETLID